MSFTFTDGQFCTESRLFVLFCFWHTHDTEGTSRARDEMGVSQGDICSLQNCSISWLDTSFIKMKFIGRDVNVDVEETGGLNPRRPPAWTRKSPNSCFQNKTWSYLFQFTLFSTTCDMGPKFIICSQGLAPVQQPPATLPSITSDSGLSTAWQKHSALKVASPRALSWPYNIIPRQKGVGIRLGIFWS